MSGSNPRDEYPRDAYPRDAYPRDAYPRDAYPRDAYPREGTWSYDGSLEGLLVLAHRAYSECCVPEAVANALAVEGELFALLGPPPLRGVVPLPGQSPLRETADLAQAAEAAGSVLRAFSGELFDMVIRIWMSEAPLELSLFHICARSGLHGNEVLADHRDAELRAVLRASRRVSCEIHKLTGLARFFPTQGGLYAAALEPDHNIIAALLPHFARRFGSEDFALVDAKRELALARRGGHFESAEGEAALAYLAKAKSEGDEEVALWKRYFRATENPARRNPQLQRRLMPRRYWRYLPELAAGG